MSDNTDYERETYSIEVCTVLICQYDESYHDADSDEVCVAEFDDWDEAYRFFESYRLDPPELTTTRRGLDSVTCEQVSVYSDFWEDGEVVDSLRQDVRIGLPETWNKALGIHQREYHEFLDYRRGYFRSLRDIIDSIDEGRE